MAVVLSSAHIKTSDYNNIGLEIEIDAILAVVIGGTLMSGGRFSLLASVIGALVMQATTTSMYAIGVPPNAVLAVKGIVVFLVLLLYSEQVRGLVRRMTAQKKEA
jgi:simple sugar transport system permease protein